MQIKYIARAIQEGKAGSGPLPIILSINRHANTIATVSSLSGDAYQDQLGYIWWQMTPGATIYHTGTGKVKNPTKEALDAERKGQEATVFKLVSPDGTGGSWEVIIKNPENTKTIGTGEPVTITPKILESDPRLQGSYNYSETIEMGLSAHELRDVLPHKKN